jgi:hypothetical protein
MKDGSICSTDAMLQSRNASIVVQVNVHASGRDGSSSRYIMHLAGSPEPARDSYPMSFSPHSSTTSFSVSPNSSSASSYSRKLSPLPAPVLRPDSGSLSSQPVSSVEATRSLPPFVSKADGWSSSSAAHVRS